MDGTSVPVTSSRITRTEASKGSSQKAYTTQVNAQDTTVKVLWNGRSELVVPKLKTTLAVLGDVANIHDPEIRDPRNLEHLSEAEFVKQMREICANGDRFSAIELVRVRRGMSLAEAKQYVDNCVHEVC